MGLGWTAYQLENWVGPSGHHWQIDYFRPEVAYEMRRIIFQHLERQQICKMMRQPAGQSLTDGIDVVFHQKYLAKVKPEDRALFHVLWQGSLQHWANSQYACCPHCAEELTLHHMFYKCSWTLQQCGCVPAMRATLVDSPDQVSFWYWGLLPGHWTRVPDVTDVEIAVTGCFEQPTYC